MVSVWADKRLGEWWHTAGNKFPGRERGSQGDCVWKPFYLDYGYTDNEKRGRYVYAMNILRRQQAFGIRRHGGGLVV